MTDNNLKIPLKARTIGTTNSVVTPAIVRWMTHAGLFRQAMGIQTTTARVIRIEAIQSSSRIVVLVLLVRLDGGHEIGQLGLGFPVRRLGRADPDRQADGPARDLEHEAAKSARNGPPTSRVGRFQSVINHQHRIPPIP